MAMGLCPGWQFFSRERSLNAEVWERLLVEFLMSSDLFEVTGIISPPGGS
jgi:hypothetical protein